MPQISIPPQFTKEHARRWQDVDAAMNYAYRAPYPKPLFEILRSFIRDEPRTVLDIGCGTGNIARELASDVRRIDAIDWAAEMIDVGKGLPCGSADNIRWQVARAEDARLDPPYALIVGGQSLHWMEWHTILPRFAACLTPNGVLAVASVREPRAMPWSERLQEIIARYSTAKDYVPFDMIPAWENAGLFAKTGERETAPVMFEQPIEAFISAFHAMSTLTRAHIDSKAFDCEVRGLMQSLCADGTVRRQIIGHVVWGKPLPGTG
jgi:ubiquinone/menaquinone biosynthesis C-methylase UbiE